MRACHTASQQHAALVCGRKSSLQHVSCIKQPQTQQLKHQFRFQSLQDLAIFNDCCIKIARFCQGPDFYCCKILKRSKIPNDDLWQVHPREGEGMFAPHILSWMYYSMPNYLWFVLNLTNVTEAQQLVLLGNVVPHREPEPQFGSPTPQDNTHCHTSCITNNVTFVGH